MVLIPDLLHLEPRLAIDRELCDDILQFAFMGKETADGIDQVLGSPTPPAGAWQAEFFAESLFLKEMIEDWFTLVSDGTAYKVNHSFLLRVIAHPPTDPEAIRFRQQILLELESDEGLCKKAHRLYRELRRLLSMLKMPGPQMRLDANVIRLDVLNQIKWVIDYMVSDFDSATSGLRRLHEVGQAFRESSEYRQLAALLDYENRLASLNVDINIGAHGGITALEIREISENKKNLFYRSPLWRNWERLKLASWYGFKLTPGLVVGRLIHRVYEEIMPALTPLMQLIGHLEFYLASQDYHRKAKSHGLEVSLARFDDADAPLHLERLFNPLLLRQGGVPVPCDLQATSSRDVTILTGPNSSGKTRFLQALGLAQLLGQSGTYAPAARADLPILEGMFVSLVERDTVDQTEGRLGQELRRIRTMFDAMGSASMVILDELCSGTNPSEGEEVFTLVLQLLEKLGGVAFIVAHFLDYARRLEDNPPIAALKFLQVEIDGEHHSTYQLIPGVARTSLAAVIAQRLGVTYEELSSTIEKRRAQTRAEAQPRAVAATPDDGGPGARDTLLS